MSGGESARPGRRQLMGWKAEIEERTVSHKLQCIPELHNRCIAHTQRLKVASHRHLLGAVARIKKMEFSALIEGHLCD